MSWTFEQLWEGQRTRDSDQFGAVDVVTFGEKPGALEQMSCASGDSAHAVE